MDEQEQTHQQSLEFAIKAMEANFTWYHDMRQRGIPHALAMKELDYKYWVDAIKFWEATIARDEERLQQGSVK